MERLQTDTRLEGDAKAMRSEDGSGFGGNVLRLCDEHRIRCEFTKVGTLQRDVSAEIAFSIAYSIQMAARGQAHVTFPGADIPKRVGPLRAKALS